MKSEPDEKTNPQVQESMQVVTSDGKLIGYVTKVRKKDFRVHRIVAADLNLPYTVIETISAENGITLNLSEHELVLKNWPCASLQDPHAPKR